MKTITFIRSFIVAVLFLWLQPNQVFSASFTKGNLVVARVANATPGWQSVYFDEYTPSGTLVQTVALPATASGSNRPIGIDCQSGIDGTLNLSEDKRYLLMGGYKTGLSSVLASAGNTRIVATVANDATINTTTELSDIGTSNLAFRSVVSTNGTNLWLSGSFGINYTTLGASTSTNLINTFGPTNQGIYDNKLYFSSYTSTNYFGSMNNGLPTSGGNQAITVLAASPTPNIGIIYPMSFVMFDMDASIVGVDVMYVAENSKLTGTLGANSARGIMKYCLNSSGVWVKTGAIIQAPIATNGLKGLTGVYNAATGTVSLYATTVSTTVTDQTSIVTLIDNSGYNGALAGTFTTLTTSASGTAFRGIAFAPLSSASATVPDAPVSVAATSGNSQASVAFSTPNDNGGSVITGYTVIPYLSGVAQTPVNGTSSPIAVTGLTNGSAYTFKVFATNGVGTGALSPASAPITPTSAVVPGTPTAVVATAGNTNALVAFVAPSSNGGSAITGYTVTPYVGAVAGTPVSGTGSPILVSGLTNGTTYTFTVKATNSVGNSSASAASNAITPVVVLFTKGNLVVSRVANATAGWQNVYLDEYSPTGTLVQSIMLPNATSGNNRPIGIDCQSGADGTLNLSADKAYLLMGGYKTGIASVLSTSGNTRIVARVDNSGTINTTTELSDIGTTAWGFKSVISTNGTNLWLSGLFGLNYTTLGASSSTNLNALNVVNQEIYDNKLYFCSGTNVNTFGYLNNGLPTTGGQPYTVLGGTIAPAPIIGVQNPLSFVMFDMNAGIAGADVMYVAEYTTGVRGLTKYCLDGNGLWVKKGTTIAPTGATYGIKGLTGVYNAATGAVTLYATTVSSTVTDQTSIVTLTDNTGYNGLLAGAFTNLATSAAGTAFRGIAFTPQASVPGAPTTVFATGASMQASVAFSTPDDHGSAIISYTVIPYDGVTAGTPATGTSSPIVVTGLTNGKVYTFKVSATNAVGAGALSDASNAVNVAIPIPITSLTVSPISGIIGIGETCQINSTIAPVEATNKYLSYTSSNTAVATVNASGLITGVARGTATINVSNQDGSKTATFSVSVYSNVLSLASLFNDNMVLQQNMPVALWGWAAPNASVAISASWGQTATATADAAGKWATTIQTPPAITGSTQPAYTLTFTAASNAITVTNILIGDVYFASGQSNMAYGLSSDQNSATEIPTANYPNLRYCAPLLINNLQKYPFDYWAASWNVCTPTNAKSYSAVAYYFAKELHIDPQINIPIGLVVSSVGGTYCEQWTSREALTNDAVLKTTYLDRTYSDRPSTSLYNGQIAPYIPFSLKGFIWYQGENNSGQTTYTRLFSAMINDWRSRWGQGNLPFYFVQLAPFTQAGFEVIREQQANTLVLPNTGMAVITDIGELTTIHPHNKMDVGKRLSLWAKAKIYGEDIVYTGPLYKSMKVEGSNIRISFHPASIGSGLEAMGGGTNLNEFMIGGADNIMVPANAVIDGNDVLVSATSVPNPTNVWFAYRCDTQPTLRNKNGLMASPFRTNGWDNTISIPSIVSETISFKKTSICIVPANGSTLISGFPKGQILSIYNLLGLQVFSQKVTGENIRVSLPKGIYLIRELGKQFLIQ